MKLVYDEDALVTIQLTGAGFPEGVRAELTGPFSNIVTTRNSSTSVTVTAAYAASGANIGESFDLTLKKGRFKYVYQGAIEIIEPLSQPLSIGSIKPGSVDANNVGIPAQISGAGFDATTTISISGSGVTFVADPIEPPVSTTDITGTLTAGIGAAAGVRNITVTKGSESDTLIDAIEVIPVIIPIGIASISPDELPRSTTRNYAITGNDFVDPVSVTISGADVAVNSVTFTDSTRIVANITVGAGAALTQRNVTVTNPNTNTATLTNGVTITTDTAIIIDSDWLTANGPAPYYLNQAGQTYRLATNVTADGTAFAMTADNVTLDLDTYEIRFATSALLPLLNPSFATDLSDWDFSGASGATWIAGTFTPATAFETGGGSVQITVAAGTTKYFETDYDLTLLAGKTYALAFWTSVVTGITATVGGVSIGTVSGNKLGTHAVSTAYKPSTNTTGRLRITMANTSATSRTYYIDDFVFGLVRQHGVCLPHVSGTANLEGTPGVTGSKGLNCSIIGTAGSKIIQNSGSYDCSCAYIRSGTNFTINGPIEFQLHEDGVMGLYGKCVMAEYAINPTLTGGLKLNALSRRIRNRELYDGHAVTLTVQNGDVTVDGVESMSAPGGVIACSSNGSTASDCVVKNISGVFQAKFTNGFFLTFRTWTGTGEIQVENITFDATSDGTAGGRFIHLDSCSVPISLTGNVCVNREQPNNQEYGGPVAGGAWGLQIENQASGITVDGDSYTLIGENGGAPLRLKGNPFNASITNSDAIVDVSAIVSGKWSHCIAVESTALSEATLNNLNLVTNAGLLQTGQSNTGTLLIEDSTFRYINDGFLTKPFRREWLGSGLFIFRNLDFYDSGSRDYVQSGWTSLGSGTPTTTTVSFDEECTLTFTDGVTPLVGVAITIVDANESIVFGPAVTNASGQISGTFTWFTTTRTTTTESSLVLNPFEISSDRNASTFAWTLTQDTRTPTFNLDA